MSDPTSTPLPPNHHRDFPGFAGIGGAIAGLTMLPGAGPVARLAINLMAVSDHDHVVDVGCGPGSAARAAARRGAAVTGVDPATVMLKLARWLTPRAASITWSEGTAEALPLADHSATVLWSLKTVHHWSDLDAGLAEAHRVLVPGGRLLAIERHTQPGATGLDRSASRRLRRPVPHQRLHQHSRPDSIHRTQTPAHRSGRARIGLHESTRCPPRPGVNGVGKHELRVTTCRVSRTSMSELDSPRGPDRTRHEQDDDDVGDRTTRPATAYASGQVRTFSLLPSWLERPEIQRANHALLAAASPDLDALLPPERSQVTGGP